MLSFPSSFSLTRDHHHERLWQEWPSSSSQSSVSVVLCVPGCCRLIVSACVSVVGDAERRRHTSLWMANDWCSCLGDGMEAKGRRDRDLNSRLLRLFFAVLMH